MLLAAALTLAVPVIGWQSVKQLYSSLQQTRIDEQTLKVANLRVTLAETAALQSLLDVGSTPLMPDDWYAEYSDYPIFVDGYADDWKMLLSPPLVYASSTDRLRQFSLRVSRREQSLYLFVDVTDDSVVWHQPVQLDTDAGEGERPDRHQQVVNGDALQLLLVSAEGGVEHGLFRAIAPGPITALVASDGWLDPAVVGTGKRAHRAVMGQSLERWRGFWVRNTHGYQLEMELPLPQAGTLVGIALLDVDTRNRDRVHWIGSLGPDRMRSWHEQTGSDTDPNDRYSNSGRLYFSSSVADSRLRLWATPGSRVRLYDSNGRLLSDINDLYARDTEEIPTATPAGSLMDALLYRVFAWLVAGDLPLLAESEKSMQPLHLSEEQRSRAMESNTPTSRYVTLDNDRVLGTLVPVGDPLRGYLLFESNEEHTSAYARSRLARLFSLLLLVSLLAGSVLLIYAMTLSVRIRRLSWQTRLAVADDGRVHGPGLPVSDARDEIGELSRSLSALLSRSAAYTAYLEALSSRLSHELRTPLSVVKTSIENLDRDRLDEESLTLIDRASGGADQLSAIIRALIESTRLEQTVQQMHMVEVEMSDWLSGSLERYRQIYPKTTFTMIGSECELETSEPAMPIPSVRLLASPELLQQALDKLVDNAVDFSTGGAIKLVMSVESGSFGHQLYLAVANQGNPVGSRQGTDHHLRLFAPMFSERSGKDERLHLGLGLYVVRMIAEAHGGKALAEDFSPWVVFGMRLPLA